MYKQEIFVQTENNVGAIRRGLLMSATAAKYLSLTVAVAYATTQGCKMVTEDFQKVIPNWNRLRKRWLISFDFGITDPGALELLADLSRSEVRVPNALKVIRSRLRPSVRFHPKLYLFEGVSHSLFSGSANLTPSGLIKNQEQGIFQSWEPPMNRSDMVSFRNLTKHTELIHREYDKGSVLTKELLASYTATRDRYRHRMQYIPEDPSFVEQISDRVPGLALSKAALMAASRSFWVEVGNVVHNLGATRPGNQIDLQSGSRVFFGFDARRVDRNTPLGEVSVRFNDTIAQCHMRFGNNSMDKLTLPIPNNPGPPSYENTTLLFERGPAGTFVLTVGTPEQVRRWKENSEAVEGRYQLVGGREFGVF